ncbi:UDP-N-acetylmuramoyl-L-alanine--D-glutamate ligase [Merismopedia glauca]|uniref:UDP-N-acetylmuramoylalanine--D-glutamate ligase n=1 Tax=Merismopedia glauca CCAP 1448/3 TaxID=1296344 RepID=A0A2T1C1U1_9CYAN|nr:UDP-N-acetylmuramoyl-L-alanine--D-glutamate ligase [Merismopedia glauca]PSB02231.1 UDP-N-acetylmuramoyl-L-alanine--D-glutamate ligase [Merismopedia glauca CCAP 1448/3]
MSKAHVIGLGKSGIAAAKLLKQQDWEVILSDAKSSAELEAQQSELSQAGITVKLNHSLTPDASLDLIVVSPGVRWDLPALVEARNRGIETIGEMELAWRYLKSIPWVAITGTNGKTTTTALISAIFKTAGLNAPACGNIGHAACEIALQESKPDWVIAEISSYQIESSDTLAPQIGVWTTFTPDHLNRHYTLENYYQIKAQLLQRSEQQVFNGDDPYLHQVGSRDWSNACWTSVDGKQNLLGNLDLGVYIEGDWVIDRGEKVIPINILKMPGKHNLQNLLMSVAAARFAGIDKEAIAQAISTFPGVPHRLEYICTWQGIDFINDSKATNYDAAEVGLVAVDSPVILIAGGEAKAGDDNGWLQRIKEKAAFVLLIGDAASAFSQRLSEVGYSNYEIVETMEKAVTKAAEIAPQYEAKIVLLSPACASFDRYQNFEQRGDDFRFWCQKLE